MVKNYGEIALKLCNDYLQGLNEQEKQDLYMFKKQYECIKKLKEHEQQDHEWKCDLCNKQYGCIKELKEHEKGFHKWKCDRCKRQYISMEELEKHLKKEHGVRNFCLECGKGFDTEEELFEHEYCYMCEQCDNEYESIEELEDHIKMEHIENFYSSHDESVGNDSYESEEELGEIDTIEKQKVKEFESLEVSNKETMLVHEKGNDKPMNSNEIFVAEDNERIDEIIQQEKTSADNNIDLEYDEHNMVDKIDKIEKSIQINSNVEINTKDRTVDSNKLLHESTPFNNLHNNNTEGVKKDNSYTDPIAGDHINLDENRIENIKDTIEEELGQDDQYEDSSESTIVINDQSSHPEDDKIEVE